MYIRKLLIGMLLVAVKYDGLLSAAQEGPRVAFLEERYAGVFSPLSEVIDILRDKTVDMLWLHNDGASWFDADSLDDSFDGSRLKMENKRLELCWQYKKRLSDINSAEKSTKNLDFCRALKEVECIVEGTSENIPDVRPGLKLILARAELALREIS